jgi:hypothetical protein
MASSSERRETARQALAERARRISAIRRRVFAGALAAFVMAWSVIAWSGSMGATSAASTTSAGTTQSQDEPSAVTTGQS